jgi:hypothetical protein
MRSIVSTDPAGQEWVLTASWEIVATADLVAALAASGMTPREQERTRARLALLGPVNRWGWRRTPSAWHLAHSNSWVLRAECGGGCRQRIAAAYSSREATAALQQFAAAIERGEIGD